MYSCFYTSSGKFVNSETLSDFRARENLTFLGRLELPGLLSLGSKININDVLYNVVVVLPIVELDPQDDLNNSGSVYYFLRDVKSSLTRIPNQHVVIRETRIR